MKPPISWHHARYLACTAWIGVAAWGFRAIRYPWHMQAVKLTPAILHDFRHADFLGSCAYQPGKTPAKGTRCASAAQPTRHRVTTGCHTARCTCVCGVSAATGLVRENACARVLTMPQAVRLLHMVF